MAQVTSLFAFDGLSRLLVAHHFMNMSSTSAMTLTQQQLEVRTHAIDLVRSPFRMVAELAQRES